MDSDEDFQSILPQEEPSPQFQSRRLKRLKKANHKSPVNSSLEPTGDPLLISSVDFSKLYLDFNDSNSADDLLLHQESVPQGNIDENENASKDNLDVGSNAGVKKKTKRVLEFDSENVGDVGERSTYIEMEKEQSAEEIFPEKRGSKKKNKIRKSHDTDKPVNTRREEKERKAYLKELHAESQRLLRESSGAAFKPAPVTRKPISSILEKIRKRKLELSKKFSIPNDQTRSEDDNSLREKVDFEVPNINEIKTVEKDMVTSGVDVQRSLIPPKLDGCEDVRPINHEDVNKALNQDPMLPFRAPLQDTEDLFDDSQSNDNAVEPDSEKQSGPLDEKFVPSVLDINLKFDSVPTDDSSSDDEDNDKENVDPIHVFPGGSSAIGDYVKNFVDDEAEEEDDSDHDPDLLHENEEGEDVENDEDLEDMIATEYEERPIDKETRNTLHQQWLEQQDATGTDNLLQRLKCGQGIRDTILPDKEPESDEDDEGFDDDEDDEAQERMVPGNSARVTTRMAKQIILQMFSDKEDVYLSDDEDTHGRIAKERLIKNEEKGTSESPVDDEDSCEVFGIIKKLDMATGNKKKPKPSSYFDTVLKGGNSNSSSKSSFLGRVSNHPIQSSKKQGSGTVRSFIFGRDDSSSWSSITVSEDTSDPVSREIQPTRSFTAKLSSSQTKFSSKNIDTAASTTSLLEILKRPSSQSNICNQDTTVDLSKSIFSFKVPKTTMKIQGRS
ncbi:uncharacterized protein LOC142521371 [Primulina tabacum]|uniref:uncharacterized protein LOC142521371 n=1 Tax=Primulina tabacum TaxID=48773 RepID=UPI003F5A5178